MRKASATTPPLSCFPSPLVPAPVPPLRGRSTAIKRPAPGLIASLCPSRVPEPYSRSYSTLTTSAGSLPSLRTGTKPTPSLYAMGAGKMKPRDTMPPPPSIRRSPMRCRRPSMAARNAAPSLRSVVMSLKRIPGLGKSRTSRMREASSLVCTATEHTLASRPDEARSAHALLPARVLLAHRARRRRLFLRHEPDRPADHPLQGRALLRGHRADDRRGEAPRGHGPRRDRHRSPLALHAERLLRRREGAGRRRAHGQRRLRRARGTAPRPLSRIRLDPDGRPGRGAGGAGAGDGRAAHAGRRAALEHPRTRPDRPGLPAVLRGGRPAPPLRVRPPDDPARGRAVQRVRARADRRVSVRHDAGGREALLRGSLRAAAEHPLADRARRRRHPLPP